MNEKDDYRGPEGGVVRVTRRLRGKVKIYYENLIRVDYENDKRSLTGKMLGDPMPEQSALYLKEHENAERQDADESNGSGEVFVDFED